MDHPPLAVKPATTAGGSDHRCDWRRQL